MAKNSSKRRQKMYNMRGCSKKRRCAKGGASLAYTGQPINLPSNPHLAFTGAGVDLSRAYPNPGPSLLRSGTPQWNPSGPQRGGCGTCGMSGGGCGCGMTGGSCVPLCSPVNLTASGGGRKHRDGCKCSECKAKMTGGTPYPNGLVGAAMNAEKVNTLPGVDGIPGNRNYYAGNPYINDISRQMKGGKRRRNRTRKQRGGGLIPDDLVNLGRYIPYTVGSVYNGLMGYNQPVSPMPYVQPSLVSDNTQLIHKFARV